MAILWQKQTSDTLYEVRTAGNSVRLYTNGVFHSQYNPANSVTGNVWDLLSLPALLLPLEQPLNVLLLGVGGGAVIRQLQQWRAGCTITGIELNATHLNIARRFFGIDARHANLVQADARHWLRQQRTAKYDLIIDDLFGHDDGEAQRAIAATREWVTVLQRLLLPGGVIVTNFADRRELMGSAYLACKPVRKAFATGFQLSTPLYENRIGVFARRPQDLREFRNRIKSIDVLQRALRRGVLNYRLRKL